MKVRVSPALSLLFRRGLLLVLLCTASVSSFAQPKLVPPGERKFRSRGARAQLAERRAQSIDAGDFYTAPEGKRSLHRLAGALVVRVNEKLERTATVKALSRSGDILDGYALDFEVSAGFTVLKADSTKRQLHLSQPSALQETIARARKSAVLHSANPLFIDPQTGYWLIPTTNIIICLQPNIDPKTYFGTNWARARRLAGMDDQFVVSVPTTVAEEMLTEVNRHAADARVRWAQPDFISQEVPQTLDPLYPKQWHLHNTGQTGATPGADIHAEQAWAMTTGNSNIVIAVIDDAIQINHPDLKANIFTNPGEISGNGVDDDGNGYIDDVHGWNFGNNSNDPSPTSSDANHGTQTAGMAIAVANNNLGVAGVAYGCKLLPITGLNISDSQRAETFYYASGRTRSGGTWRGADVISFSVTRPQASVIDAALHYAVTSGRGGKGCPIFCSSGNDAAGWYPWSLDISSAGTHTIQWNYNKSSTMTECDDTSWLDGIVYTDGTIESFEGGGFPADWTTGGDTSWARVANGVNGNHGLIGWDGSSSHALRAGHVNTTSQQSYVSLTRFMPAGTFIFNLWTSSSYTNGWLDVWLDDVYQYSDTGCTDVSTPVAYPASSADTIATGASTDFDFRADFSEYGNTLDFLAPGGGGIGGIPSTDRTGSNGDNTSAGTAGDYSLDFTGTSASAPISAGVAALVLSFNPGVTAGEIRSILRRSCDKVGGVTYDSNGFNAQYGFGRINAFRALTNSYADLQVSIRANLNPAVASSNLTYTMTISNAGPSSASNLSLTNVFDQSVTFISASPTATSISSNKIVWRNMSRLATKTATKVTLTVRPRAYGSIYSSTIVSSSAPDPDSSNNNATLTVPTFDLTRPSVTIVSPAAGQRITNSSTPITCRGRAADNISVADVQIQLNGGDWMPATTGNGFANWTATVTPPAGTNRVRAYATDSSGNVSVTNGVSFFYVVPSSLTLVTNGIGSISRAFKGDQLEVGRAYTMTAVAGANQVFSNWVSASFVSSSPVLQFIMQSNLVITANFIPNPFLSAQGRYRGLFSEPVRAQQRSGFFSMALTDQGGYSASLTRGTNAFPFSGQFDVSGVATNNVNGWRVAMSIDLGGSQNLTGTVGTSNWEAELLANHCSFSALSNPATAFKGAYTLIVPGAAGSTTLPAGHGYAALTVGLNGSLALAGTLADNAVWSQGVPLSSDGQWACYASLYGGLGSIWGWLLFDTNQPVTQISGTLDWIRPAIVGGRYPLGFTNDAVGQGARYTAPTNSTPVIALTDGLVAFADGNLSGPFTNLISFGLGNRVTNLSANQLSMSIVRSNGLFSGSVKIPDAARTNNYKGAFLQDSATGYGFFLGPGLSGGVFVGPQP